MSNFTKVSRVGLIATMLCMVAACKSPADLQKEADDAKAEASQEADYARISKEIDTRGFAQVGTTPDDKPLYVKFVKVGKYAYTDTVYFTGDSIVAGEQKGKVHTIVTTIQNVH